MRGAHPGTGLIAAALLFGGSLISLFTAHVQAARTFSPGQDQPVISEFRSNGPAAGYETQDDFVEIFNPSGHDISLSGWYIESITSSGTHKLLARFPTGALLTPGQHYLITGLHYSGAGTPDDQFATGGIPDGGVWPW